MRRWVLVRAWSVIEKGRERSNANPSFNPGRYDCEVITVTIRVGSTDKDLEIGGVLACPGEYADELKGLGLEVIGWADDPRRLPHYSVVE